MLRFGGTPSIVLGENDDDLRPLADNLGVGGPFYRYGFLDRTQMLLSLRAA